MFQLIKTIALFSVLTFCATSEISATQQPLTLETINNLRKEVMSAQAELVKTKAAITRSQSALAEIPPAVIALTKEEFAKAIGLTDPSALNMDSSTFNYNEIQQKANAAGNAISDEGKQDQFAKFWYTYRLAYFQKKQKDQEQKLAPQVARLSELEKERPKLIQQETIAAAQKQGVIGEPSKVQSIHPKANFAEQIVFIKGNTCPLAAKVFKDLEKYKEEYKEFSEAALYVAMVNQFREKCDKNLPVFVEAKAGMTIGGGTTGVLLLAKAKGKTMGKIQESVPEMDDARIVAMFTEIGRQLGHLDGLFYQNKEGQQIVHPDPHQDNIFYDEKGHQVYWIDYAGLNFRPYQNLLSGSGFFDNYRPDRIEIYAEKRAIKPEDKEEMKKWGYKYLNVFHKRLLAMQSIYKAYAAEMKKVGVSLDDQYQYLITSYTKSTIDLFNQTLEELGIKERIDLSKYSKL